MIQTGLGLIGNREGIAGIAPQLQQGFGQFNQGVRESIEARLLQQDVARQGNLDQREDFLFKQRQGDRTRILEEERVAKEEEEKALEEAKLKAFDDEEFRSETLGKLKEAANQQGYGDNPSLNTLYALIDQSAKIKDWDAYDGYINDMARLMDSLEKKEDPVFNSVPGVPGILFDKDYKPIRNFRHLIPETRGSDHDPSKFGPGTKHGNTEFDRWWTKSKTLFMSGETEEIPSKPILREGDIEEGRKAFFKDVYWQTRTPFGSDPNAPIDGGDPLTNEELEVLQILAGTMTKENFMAEYGNSLSAKEFSTISFSEDQEVNAPSLIVGTEGTVQLDPLKSGLRAAIGGRRSVPQVDLSDFEPIPSSHPQGITQDKLALLNEISNSEPSDFDILNGRVVRYVNVPGRPGRSVESVDITPEELRQIFPGIF